MPELPEVESLKRYLSPLLSGKVISAVRVIHPALIQNRPHDLIQALTGEKIAALERRGKFLGLKTEKAGTLWFHLGMTGQLPWKDVLELKDPHLHFYLEFRGISHKLCFRDIRKFGKILFAGTGQPEPRSLRQLGPEPFDLAKEKFIFLLKERTGKIKGLLLNQRLIAGLGNIYADESLFRAQIHPKARPSRLKAERIGRLFDSIQEVFKEAIANGGSSIDDYRLPDGSRGEFQNKHQVYGRKKSPCIVCGNLIRVIVLSGRSSHFCSECQKY